MYVNKKSGPDNLLDNSEEGQILDKFVRLKIETRDRIGMTSDILNTFNKYHINLKALEVGPGIISVKIDNDFSIELGALMKELVSIKDVINVVRIHSMPQELKEKYINAVLNATGEGIIAVDKEGLITTFNQAAEKILNLESQNVIGKHVEKVISKDAPILKMIETGEIYDNEEIILQNKNQKSHYFTSGRPIIDLSGTPVGAVASLTDIDTVMKLVHSVTKPSMNTFDDILGNSKSIVNVKKMALAVAKSDSTVCIRGESGTGKELFARALHMASPRRNNPFVAINCGALPPTLLESELFGYEEGSFTGAKKGGKQGLFKYADKGTIFLDEIGDLPSHLQVKLLRVLQEHKIRRIGSNEETSINVRVITATNKNLEEMIENDQFRQDLYYRLNVIPLLIPPLRERKEDIPMLVNDFVNKLSKRLNKGKVDITDDAMRKLVAYTWAGNVRELSNVIERAINLCEDKIEIHHVILRKELPDTVVDINSFQKITRKTLNDLVADAEKNAIKEALKEYGSIRKTARALGVTHATIINKMKRYNISK